MDNYNYFRLGEIATELEAENKRLTQRIEQLELNFQELISLFIPMRLEKLEKRMNLMMCLKTANNLDLSKFTCDIPPLAPPIESVES